MPVRAKFRVDTITESCWNKNARTIKMSAVYDDGIEENKRFFDATPSGTLEMLVNNPSTIEQLELGKTFYIDFTPAE
jgi:hypothetical protein